MQVYFNTDLKGSLPEIRKLTTNIEAVLLGVLIPLCQRNSGRLEETDREVKHNFGDKIRCS